MTTVTRYIKTKWEMFWELVDGGNIVVQQIVFYVLISLSGLYNLVAGFVPIQSMQESTSLGYYSFWLWICFLGPLTTILGKSFRGAFSYAGLWLELAGDTATWFVFVAYVSAIFGTAFWGKGLFAGFLAVACLIGTPIFIARDIRRLRQVEEIAHKNGG